MLLLLLCRDMSNRGVCLCAEPSPEEKVQKLHTDIKFALKVDNPVRDADPVTPPGSGPRLTVFFLVVHQDIERCLQALEELEAVPVTSQILQRNAEVIATLKKVPLQSPAPSPHFFPHHDLRKILLFVDNLDPAI